VSEPSHDELFAALAAAEVARGRGREVTVPPEWRVGTRRKIKRPRWKACYVAAVQYVLSHPDLAPTLVHGTYMRDPWPVPTPHAWVEIESTTVYDGVTGRFYDRTSYYETTHAVAEAKYSVREAAERMLSENHCGPWHDVRPEVTMA
jgi:hypothetical protein